ncbi:MAG: DUF262 domain-containing protein [Culicoidibacterales bacterium]
MAQLDNSPARTGLLDFVQKSIGTQFVIPVYQRNYTWGPKKETLKLLEDIKMILEGKDDVHFMGIIMYLPKSISFSFHQLLIVDGQQRLTTFFLILLAIRKRARADGNEQLAEIIDNQYLYNKYVEDENKLRLKPLVSDDDVYGKLVSGLDFQLVENDFSSNVYRNFGEIEQWLKGVCVDASLNDVMQALDKLYIISIPLLDSDNAQQIFESINSTGAPLTSADLIRNYILMNYTNDLQEHYYLTYWKTLESLQPDSYKLEEFFRYYLSIKNYVIPNKRDVYTDFKVFWEKSTVKTEAKLVDIINYARYYNAIFVDEHENGALMSILSDLRKNKVALVSTFLVEMYGLYDTQKITLNTLIDLIKIIQGYLVRRWVCHVDTSAISRYFPLLLAAVLSACDGNYDDIVAKTKYHLVNLNKSKGYFMPTDEQIVQSLENNNAYLITCLRGLLDTIENFNNNAPVDLRSLNVEHIMPKTASSYWLKNSGVGEQDYDKYCNLIGNLTLSAIFDNSKMGNGDFEMKKELLKNTNHLRINENVLKQDSWGKTDIIRRTNWMIEQIILIYPYNEQK